MPKVMFEVVALVFEDVDTLILDFPAGASTRSYICDRTGIDDVIRGPSIAIEQFPGNVVDDSQFTPIDKQGILPPPRRRGRQSAQR